MIGVGFNIEACVGFAFVVHLKSEMPFQHAAVGMIERRFRAMGVEQFIDVLF